MHYPSEHVTREAPGSVFKFWVGDVSYHPAIKAVWDDVCAGYDFDVAAIQTFNDRLMAAHGTAYGDGEFLGSDGWHYAVDAGVLGFVEWKPEDGADVPGMVLVDFREMPMVAYHHGEVCVGMNTSMGISIDTTEAVGEDEGTPVYYDGDDDSGLSDDY